MGCLDQVMENAKNVSNYLKGMAHEVRLVAICCIGEGEKTVQELEEIIGTTQSNVSQHLSKLREKGILQTRKEGNLVYYSVTDKKTLELIRVLNACKCR